MLLAERVVRTRARHVDLAVLPTRILDVVTIQGSLDTRLDYANGEDLVQDWVVRTLDKGTRTRDRFEVAGALEDVGATISFSAATGRIRFSARLLKRDLETVIGLLFEQLVEPEMDAEELRKSRERIGASIQQSRTDAGYRATARLCASLFPPGHPNAMIEPDAEAAILSAIQDQAARAFHRQHVLGARPRMVIVGDVDPAVAHRAVEGAAAGWPEPAAPSASILSHPPSPAGTARIPLSDRDNLEIRWGRALPVAKSSPDYLAAYMASFILGGNFSARLMAEVRDRQGLTYGIGSSLRGVDARFGGMWMVHVTLSRENLEKGIASTEAVLKDYSETGCRAAELEENKETLAGSYQVRLATTSGMAGTMLGFLEDGRDLSFLDQYPERIRALTVQEVNRAVEDHFQSEGLFTSIAGTFPDEPVG